MASVAFDAAGCKSTRDINLPMHFLATLPRGCECIITNVTEPSVVDFLVSNWPAHCNLSFCIDWTSWVLRPDEEMQAVEHEVDSALQSAVLLLLDVIPRLFAKQHMSSQRKVLFMFSWEWQHLVQEYRIDSRHSPHAARLPNASDSPPSSYNSTTSTGSSATTTGSLSATLSAPSAGNYQHQPQQQQQYARWTGDTMQCLHRLLPFGIVPEMALSFQWCVSSLTGNNMTSQEGVFPILWDLFSLFQRCADKLEAVELSDPPFRSHAAVARAQYVLHCLHAPVPEYCDFELADRSKPLTPVFHQYSLLDGRAVEGQDSIGLVDDVCNPMCVFLPYSSVHIVQRITEDESSAGLSRDNRFAMQPLLINAQSDSSLTHLYLHCLQPLRLVNLSASLVSLHIFRGTADRSILLPSQRHLLSLFHAEFSHLPNLRFLTYDVPCVQDRYSDWVFQDLSSMSSVTPTVLAASDSILRVHDCPALQSVSCSGMLVVGHGCAALRTAISVAACVFCYADLSAEDGKLDKESSSLASGDFIHPNAWLQHAVVCKPQLIEQHLPELRTLGSSVPSCITEIDIRRTRLMNLNLRGDALRTPKPLITLVHTVAPVIQATNLEVAAVDEIGYRRVGHRALNRLCMSPRTVLRNSFSRQRNSVGLPSTIMTVSSDGLSVSMTSLDEHAPQTCAILLFENSSVHPFVLDGPLLAGVEDLYVISSPAVDGCALRVQLTILQDAVSLLRIHLCDGVHLRIHGLSPGSSSSVLSSSSSIDDVDTPQLRLRSIHVHGAVTIAPAPCDIPSLQYLIFDSPWMVHSGPSFRLRPDQQLAVFDLHRIV
jgi:hypothetical protein